MSSISYTPTHNRIQFVDALRGFALAGIILFHNLHHFNFSNEAEFNPDWLQPFDSFFNFVLSFLFSGKAYAIFSMLFGVSFWIQYSNQRAKGNNFAGRFAWRMLLLFGFGVFHSVFYNGDILTFYAIFSILLIITRTWSNKTILWLSILLLLQPLELIKFIIATQDPSFHFHKSVEVYNAMLNQARINGSFLDLVQLNFTYGQLANIGWVWEYGRFCQAPGLFLLGMFFARKNAFSDIKPRMWSYILVVSLGVFAVLGTVFLVFAPDPPIPNSAIFLGVALWMYSNLAMTFVMLSITCLFWHFFPLFQRIFRLIAPYGRMSLTNYITQSVIGTTLYFGYGFGLYKYCGATLSMCIGLIILSSQLCFSHWWLRRYKQGPLEYIWKKGTWIGSKRRTSEQRLAEAAEA